MKMTRFNIVAGAFLVGLALTLTAISAGGDEGDPIPLPPQPDGACIFRNGDCQITPQNICRLARGRWQGPGTTCP